ncbi:MAG: hypothetical protein J2P25_08785 [Nocardiopsaceae bacterium]|nr:hypothetical protein [Nocardiopsaceae bacterium]
MAPEDETSTFHLENVNLRRLTVADKVAGAASLVLLISLFLPWYTVSVPGASSTLSGTGIHRFLWLAVLLSVVMLTYLIVHATVGWDSTPMNRLSHEPVLLSLCLVQLILVIVPFFDVPDTALNSVTVGFSYGAYIGLAAAVAALVMVLVPYVRSLASGR